MTRAVGACALAAMLFVPSFVLAQAGGTGGASRPSSPPTQGSGRLFEVAGFAHFGSLSLAARKSFEAILGSSSGRSIGGGGEVTFLRGPLRRVFARVDLSRFREEGQRVFVFEGQVYDLGIPETITLTPIELTVGYRYVIRRKASRGSQPVAAFPLVPYGGLGIGSARYEESSSFADPSDNIDTRFTSYLALGGVDIRIWRWIGAGVEGVYRWVPDALGAGGVSQAFNETNLNGATVRIRIRGAW